MLKEKEKKTEGIKDPIVIDEIEKNSYQTIRATLQEYKGNTFADFRIYYEKDGEQHPTKKGLSIALDLLGDFAYLVDKTLNFVESKTSKKERVK